MATLGVAALVLAACGGDDDDSADTTVAPEVTVAPTTTAAPTTTQATTTTTTLPPLDLVTEVSFDKNVLQELSLETGVLGNRYPKSIARRSPNREIGYLLFGLFFCIFELFEGFASFSLLEQQGNARTLFVYFDSLTWL